MSTQPDLQEQSRGETVSSSAGDSMALAVEKRLPAIGSAILRYGIVFLLVLWGAAKWTHDEAAGIEPWMSHSPLTSWLYGILSVQGASIAIGVVELTLAATIASRRFLPRVSGWGSAFSIGMFLVTLSFLVTTPQLDPVSQGFLMKDLILIGASVYTAGEAFKAARSRMAYSEAGAVADIAKIRAIAERYVDAARQGQSARFATDVLPTMRVQGYLRGSFVDIGIREFCDLIDTSEPATNLRAEVEAIDVSGTAASLRIDCEDWRGVHYSDLMNLLKVAGVWKVAGKVFDAHENR